MPVKIEYKPEYIGYVVIRYRNQGDDVHTLTKDGWQKKDKTKPLTFDEKDLWEDEDIRSFMEEATKLKIAPRVSEYKDGKLEATQAHLEDMRALVFKNAVHPASKTN